MSTTTAQAPTCNMDETLRLIIKAMFRSREAEDMVTPHVYAILNGVTDSLPEELADLFTVEIVTRPSGSKYAVLDFA